VAERVFRDRRDAGRVLAGLLDRHRAQPDVIVLGLPRGGVPVAYEVAVALQAPLDVFLVRKLGTPGHEELAMGAIASGGVVVVNDDVIRALRITADIVRRVAEREGRELLRRERVYRESRPPPEVAGKVVIVVDDGLATGASMRAAVLAVRESQPARVVVAVPAAPESTCRELHAVADEVVCATTPAPFCAVGASYWDFTQTTDEEVRDLLRAAASRSAVTGAPGPTATAAIRSHEGAVPDDTRPPALPEGGRAGGRPGERLQRRSSQNSTEPTTDSANETSSIDVMGMYTRTCSPPKRRSPGSRPSQDSAPAQISRPTAASRNPKTTSSGPQLRSMPTIVPRAGRTDQFAGGRDDRAHPDTRGVHQLGGRT
jgi:predicted phosphoribosyltransferase